jgi:phosphoribosylanthranilate isomerase
MTFVKICGITNLPDALAAIEAGADALGFNFYSSSPRYIAPQTAREIVDQLPDGVLKVGVFVNERSPESLRRIMNETGIDALQLHGDESPDYCRVLSDQYVIKALGVGDDFDVQHALVYDVKAIMLDAKALRLHGGTGQVIDWSIAEKVSRLIPRLFLAGGLSPANVQQAIASVKPYGVDACSALEDIPGKKNHKLLHSFIKAVRDVKP